MALQGKRLFAIITKADRRRLKNGIANPPGSGIGKVVWANSKKEAQAIADRRFDGESPKVVAVTNAKENIVLSDQSIMSLAKLTSGRVRVD